MIETNDAAAAMEQHRFVVASSISSFWTPLGPPGPRRSSRVRRRARHRRQVVDRPEAWASVLSSRCRARPSKTTRSISSNADVRCTVGRHEWASTQKNSRACTDLYGMIVHLAGCFREDTSKLAKPGSKLLEVKIVTEDYELEEVPVPPVVDLSSIPATLSPTDRRDMSLTFLTADPYPRNLPPAPVSTQNRNREGCSLGRTYRQPQLRAR
ncbi:hypothetical protein B0H13DRAFT_363635 [Mycena leptocephala]|nr:hypothetical protein B0H13DRAFT_363635 [Mycena leptocephala]